MTDERKKYLATIGKEESSARAEIAFCKKRIEWHGLFSSDRSKRWVKEYKTRIKLLKKHIPQCVYVNWEPGHERWCCPTCHYRIFDFGSSLDPIRTYCPACGQRLTELHLLDGRK